MSTRRQFSGQALALAGGLVWPAARAEFRVEISGVGATQVPVAVVRFREEERSPQAVSAIIRADLERSGLFKMVEPGVAALDENSQPNFNVWRGLNADALVGGSVTRLANGAFDVRYRLWDVVRGNSPSGQTYAATRENLRLTGHQIADDIFQKLTGERGVFATRIAYVSKSAGQHRLWVADSDGENAQTALTSAEPIISPAWSPNGRELAYVSFASRKAVVHLQDVTTGEIRVLANYKGSNSAPAWSPDGSQLVVTLTRDGLSQLYAIGRKGDNLRRLTNSSGIDTEATWSADGRSIYFVSDRGGGPQIYRMPADGGNAERVTFSGNYNISPALSPDGRYLAYITRLSSSSFRLTLMELSSGTITSLTDTNDDESPGFAPNSRLIIYASRASGRDVLMTTTLDGTIKARLATPQSDVREPTWGPFSR